MQIDESRDGGGLWINTYEPGCIEIDGIAYRQPVCLNGSQVLPLTHHRVADLTAADFQAALSTPLRPEVVLIGCGERQIFLHPRISAALAEAGIGVESMSTAAACRTYMILRSEGRRVWAWLWP